MYFSPEIDAANLQLIIAPSLEAARSPSGNFVFSTPGTIGYYEKNLEDTQGDPLRSFSLPLLLPPSPSLRLPEPILFA